MESFIQTLERKAIPFAEFVDAHHPETGFPLYWAAPLGNQEGRYLYSVEDKEAWVELHNEVKIVELYKTSALQSLQDALAEYQATIRNYLIPFDEPIVVRENDTKGCVTECYTLKDALDVLRQLGRSGIEVQRYKGLGEMNADQLWETTMNPAQRTLVRVSLKDAVEADHIFTMLMGEEVPPRRDFIESHALMIKMNNLDV